MTTPAGIQHFDAIATIAFAKLYETFPNPINLDGRSLAKQYVKSLAERPAEEDELQLYLTTGNATLGWLVEEGFIRYAENNRTLDGHPSHPGARLSMRGLTALRAVPESVAGEGPKKPLGEQAVDALSAGTKVAIGEISKSIVTGVAQAFFRTSGWG